MATPKKTVVVFLVALALFNAEVTYAFPTQSLNLVTAATQYASGPSYNVTGNATVEAWVKIPTNLSGAGVLFGRSNSTISSGDDIEFEFLISQSGTDTLWSATTNDGTYNVQEITVGGSTVYNGSWHHVAAVYTAASGAVQIFLDGVSQGTITGLQTSVRTSSRAWFVGKRGNGVRFNPEINISLLRHWSTTRTSGQLSANWCTVLGSTANLELELTFDNTYNDNSGNARNFSGSGSPTFESDVPAICASGGGDSTSSTSTEALFEFWSETYFNLSTIFMLSLMASLVIWRRLV